MSIGNEIEGQYLYAAGDDKTKAWFQRQWKIWPKRADEKLTTNISLHYGGVVAYRIDNERDPEMSADFRSHVDWLDKQQPLATSRSQHEGAGR